MPRDVKDPWASPYEIQTGMGMSVALRVDQIETGYRLREVDPEKVASLKASIADIGLRTLLQVTGDRKAHTDPSIKVRLVAGAHRLEALRQLGREHVGVVFEDGDDLDAELWEIDENLCRAELTPADRALFVFRRKEIYLLKHPETGHGGERSSRQIGDLASDEPKRFTAATAEATGQSERAIQRDAERGEKISEKALRMLRGTRHDKGTVLDRLKSLREDEQEVYVKALFQADKERQAEAKEIRTDKLATKRAVRIDVINAIAAHGKVVAGQMPRAAYAVGYADPPWQQEAWSDETGQDKGLMYPPMHLDEIRALCTGDKSPFTPDAIVYLWVPSNRVDDGIVVLKDWGFEFVTMLTWDKEDIGMGRWVRDQTEHLLIGKRGNFPGLPEGSQPRSLYREKKTTHSRKPVWFAEMIDGLYPEMRKLELFQRKASLAETDVRRNGMWDFWGFEAGTDEASEPPNDAAVDPVVEKLIDSGVVANDFLLSLGGLAGNHHSDSPSRLLRAPVEFARGDPKKGTISRLLLRHPLIGDHPSVRAYLDEMEEKTGIRPAWEPLDEFGRDRGRQYRYFHALDLCTDAHWKDLLATLYLTDDDAVFNGVRFALEYKALSLKNARAVMAAMEVPEPEGRSADLLAGKGLFPYQDGKKKFIAPNISARGAEGAWLAIHGMEDGWLAYVGKFLSVTAAGMDRRKPAREAAE